MQESTDLWYPDGSLVIKAGDTLFCVYSGLLAQRSTVFEDVFKSAHPEPEETYNGRPLVEFSDDPNELMLFLKSIHDHEYLELQVLPELSQTLCVMELATKYQVAYLRSIILPRLLDRWYATSPEDFATKTGRMGLAEFRDAISIVNAARVCNAPILLPCALLACSAIMERNPGVFTSSDDAQAAISIALLSMEDRLIFASAIIQLSRALRKTAQQLAFFPTRNDLESCSNLVQCRTECAHASSVLDTVGLCRILVVPTQQRLAEIAKSVVCASCMAQWNECYVKGSKEIWDTLPSYFDLPPWEVLRTQSGLDD